MEPTDPPKSKGGFKGKRTKARSLSRYASRGNKKSCNPSATATAIAAATLTAPTPEEDAIQVHHDLAIDLSANRARKKRSRKELEFALKTNHAELLSQQNVIDRQEKKIDLLNRRNQDLSNTVLESRANCRDAKRAASRAEDNVADLLRQAEEVGENCPFKGLIRPFDPAACIVPGCYFCPWRPKNICL
jgi:septal ring factor EnvC (AmiA/AmiB activator)